jgi:hypothetical protein
MQTSDVSMSPPPANQGGGGGGGSLNDSLSEEGACGGMAAAGGVGCAAMNVSSVSSENEADFSDSGLSVSSSVGGNGALSFAAQQQLAAAGGTGPAMMPPSPVTREQLQKRIESLQQQNRVLKCELDTYKLRVKSLQEENRAIRQASVHIVSRAGGRRRRPKLFTSCPRCSKPRPSRRRSSSPTRC